MTNAATIVTLTLVTFCEATERFETRRIEARYTGRMSARQPVIELEVGPRTYEVKVIPCGTAWAPGLRRALGIGVVEGEGLTITREGIEVLRRRGQWYSSPRGVA